MEFCIFNVLKFFTVMTVPQLSEHSALKSKCGWIACTPSIIYKNMKQNSPSARLQAVVWPLEPRLEDCQGERRRQAVGLCVSAGACDAPAAPTLPNPHDARGEARWAQQVSESLQLARRCFTLLWSKRLARRTQSRRRVHHVRANEIVN